MSVAESNGHHLHRKLNRLPFPDLPEPEIGTPKGNVDPTRVAGTDQMAPIGTSRTCRERQTLGNRLVGVIERVGPGRARVESPRVQSTPYNRSIFTLDGFLHDTSHWILCFRRFHALYIQWWGVTGSVSVVFHLDLSGQIQVSLHHVHWWDQPLGRAEGGKRRIPEISV